MPKRGNQSGPLFPRDLAVSVSGCGCSVCLPSFPPSSHRRRLMVHLLSIVCLLPLPSFLPVRARPSTPIDGRARIYQETVSRRQRQGLRDAREAWCLRKWHNHLPDLLHGPRFTSHTTSCLLLTQGLQFGKHPYHFTLLAKWRGRAQPQRRIPSFVHSLSLSEFLRVHHHYSPLTWREQSPRAPSLPPSISLITMFLPHPSSTSCGLQSPPHPRYRLLPPPSSPFLPLHDCNNIDSDIV